MIPLPATIPAISAKRETTILGFIKEAPTWIDRRFLNS
jgi:hypothetical protein